MKITITINGKEHELTPDEARRIHGELQNLFGAPVQKEYVPYPISTGFQPFQTFRHIEPYSQKTTWGHLTCNTCGAGDRISLIL